MNRDRIQIISCEDARYPKNLLKLSDFPHRLYVIGEIPKEEGIGVVGTRTASLYGREVAERLGEELAGEGVTVISGLARGIDTAAHVGALKTGKTVAVIGSGFLHLYPRENRSLAEAIAQKGALISEYPPETPPAKYHFPRRNRLVSALAEKLVIVESPLKGGSMITAEHAVSQGKALYAVPGRIDCPSFEGNHHLIKTGKAHLLQGAEDLLGKKSSCFTLSAPVEFSEEERALLSLMPHDEATVEELVLLTQFPVMKLNVLLTRLVLKKVVKEFPGKIYKRIVHG